MKTNQALAQAKKSARALFKALTRQGLVLSLGQAMDVQAQVAGVADWNAYSALLTAPPAKSKPVATAMPSILDVDFFAAHAVILGGRRYNVEWREEAVLAYLGMQGSPDYADWEEQTALTLHYEEGGLIWDEPLSLGQLDALKWDAKEQLFKNPDGETFQFFMSAAFGAETVKEGPTLAVPPVTNAAAAEPLIAKYAMFQLKLESGELKYVAALNALGVEAEAVRLGHMEQGTSYLAQEVDADLYGPFLVEVNGGFYNEFESLNKAIKVAKGLLDADESLDEARVLTVQGTALISIAA